MSLDIATTNYALSNNIGYEGNSLMSGVASNLYSLIIVKFIGSMVILMLMSKILQKNEKMAKIGMRLIIFMMLFVIGNNILVIQASALVFNNFSIGGVAGSVNTGNGFFDDDAASYGYTGSRNIYVVAEPTQIHLFEPSCMSSSGCVNFNSFQAVNSTTGLLHDAVVYRGFLYFVDGTNLKKKKTRATTSVVESTDDSAGGDVIIISTGVGESLRVYNDVLFFTKGQNGIYHLDDEDNEVFDFTMTKTSSNAQIRGFTPFLNNNILHIYTSYGTVGVETRVADCTSTTCTVLSSGNLPNQITPTADTFYSTTTKIYGLTINTANNGQLSQCMYLVSNGTCTASVIITDTSIDTSRRAYVGSRSTIGLLANAATYSTFNSAELGFDSLPAAQTPDLVYQTSTIDSLETTYYNKSIIYLNYDIVISSLNVNNLLLDFGDYRWMISMTDPNGVTQDVIQSPACMFDSLVDTTCQITSSIGISPPPNGWLQGTWNAKIYEINTVTSTRALLDTSSSFTVLNTSLENQSVIPPPFIPPTSGTAPQAVTIIDGFVRWLGLGVNSVSKLLFAMIIIAIAATVGLIWGNGNVAMVFAFVPYAFFTFIDYIPKWIFIIAIILITIASRVFR